MEVYQKVAQYIVENRLDISFIAETATIPEADIRAMLDGSRTMDAVDLRNLCLAMNVSPEVFVDTSPKKGTKDHE